MARFRPYRVATATDLSNVPIREGQFIIVENTQTIYFDKSASERVVVGNGENLVTGWNDEDTVISNAAYTKAETDALLANLKDISGTFTIATTDWTADSTYTGYNYVASLTITGVAATYIPDIYYNEASKTIAAEAKADLPDTVAGGLNIYAENIPSGSISGTYIIQKVGDSV